MHEITNVLSNKLLDSIERTACKESLFEFVVSFWDEVIKEDPVYNWHIPYICNELEELAYVIINRLPKPYDLIINIPPGTTKSTICSIMFPAWLWAIDPTIRIITNSYSSDLSIELATKSRDIIWSDKYRRLFPEVEIRKDKSAKSAYENTAGGARYSTSTGGTITGKHAHVIINDDPLNPKQAVSDADRKAANEHTKTLSSRKVDKKNTPTVVIMQRLHEEDVTGYMLSKAESRIKHICCPARLGTNVKPDELKDNYIDGYLDPIRLDDAVLQEAEDLLGSYSYANQYDQLAAPQEGGLIKEDWFDIIDWQPEYANLTWHWVFDTAYTDDLNNDETAALCWAKYQNRIILRHAENVFLEFPELVRFTVSTTQQHGFTSKTKIYVEPKASGKSLVQAVRRGTKLNIIEDDNPIKDKKARVKDVTGMLEARRCVLIRGPWNENFLHVVKMFPMIKRKGLTDCLVMAMNKLKKTEEEWGSSQAL